MVNRIHTSNKSRIRGLAVLFIIVVSLSITSDANADKQKKYVFLKNTTTTYKSAGSNRLSTNLSPSIYKQYAKSGKWTKVKNSSGRYVWVSSSKKISSVKSKKYKKVELEIIRLVNIERKKRGLTTLKQENNLQQMAYVRNYDMVQQNYFSHVSPKYGRWVNFLYSSEYDFDFAGENIAAGFVTARAFVKAWMNSPTHRANILEPRFRKIAVAVSSGNSKSYYSTYATQWFSDK